MKQDLRSSLMGIAALSQKLCCSGLKEIFQQKETSKDSRNFKDQVEESSCSKCQGENTVCKRCDAVFCQWCDLPELGFSIKYNGMVCPSCEKKGREERLGVKLAGAITQEEVDAELLEFNDQLTELSPTSRQKHNLSPDLGMKDRKRSKINENFNPPQGPSSVSPFKEPHDAKKELKRKASVEVRKDNRRHTLATEGRRTSSGVSRASLGGMALAERRRASTRSRTPSLAVGGQTGTVMGRSKSLNSGALVAKLWKKETQPEKYEPEVPPTPPARMIMNSMMLRSGGNDKLARKVSVMDNNFDHSAAAPDARKFSIKGANVNQQGNRPPAIVTATFTTTSTAQAGSGVQARIQNLRNGQAAKEAAVMHSNVAPATPCSVASPAHSTMDTARSRRDVVTACESQDVDGGCYSARRWNGPRKEERQRKPSCLKQFSSYTPADLEHLNSTISRCVDLKLISPEQERRVRQLIVRQDPLLAKAFASYCKNGNDLLDFSLSLRKLI